MSDTNYPKSGDGMNVCHAKAQSRKGMRPGSHTELGDGLFSACFSYLRLCVILHSTDLGLRISSTFLVARGTHSNTKEPMSTGKPRVRGSKDSARSLALPGHA